MAVLWPGSGATGNWPETCKTDGDIRYVFGKARMFASERGGKPVEEAEIPYASEEHYRETAEYGLTMRLRALDTPNGKRWYVYSGN